MHGFSDYNLRVAYRWATKDLASHLHPAVSEISLATEKMLVRFSELINGIGSAQ